MCILRHLEPCRPACFFTDPITCQCEHSFRSVSSSFACTFHLEDGFWPGQEWITPLAVLVKICSLLLLWCMFSASPSKKWGHRLVFTSGTWEEVTLPSTDWSCSPGTTLLHGRQTLLRKDPVLNLCTLLSSFGWLYKSYPPLQNKDFFFIPLLRVFKKVPLWAIFKLLGNSSIGGVGL